MSDPSPLTPEVDLSASLGVSRELLAEARAKNCAEGADWIRGARGAISYTAAGVEKMLAALAAPAVKPDASAVDSAQSSTLGARQGADPEPAALIVIRSARMNPRLIFAREKKAGADGPEMPVRVKDARLYTPGQEISAVSEGGYWRLFGKQPRGGRWQINARRKRA